MQGKPGTNLGEIKDPDGVGEHGSIACGDALRFTFRVEKNAQDPTKDLIVEAKYLTFGCTSAIASSEALCKILESGTYTPIDALNISNQDIIDFLDGLPDQKIHCSVMGHEALEAAVFDWARKRGVNLNELGIDIRREEQEEGRLVCQCFSLTEPYIKRKIKELGLKTIAEMTDAIKAGGACGSCHHMPGGLQDLLDEVWGKGDAAQENKPRPEPQNSHPQETSPYQRIKLIEKAVDDYIRPMLKQDGGDFEIVDIKDNIIYGKLQGACAGCAGATITLKMMIEKTLKDRVDDSLRVIAV